MDILVNLGNWVPEDLGAAIVNEDIDALAKIITAKPDSKIVFEKKQKDIYDCYEISERNPSALQCALMLNKTKAVNYLKDIPEQVEAVDKFKSTFLHYVAAYGGIKLFKEIMEKENVKKLIGKVNEDGESALIYAMRYNSPLCIQLLPYEAGIKNNKGQTALIVGVICENSSLVKRFTRFLNQKGNEEYAAKEFGVFDNDNKTALIYCLSDRKTRVLANFHDLDKIEISSIKENVIDVITELLKAEPECTACKTNEEGNVIADALLAILDSYQNAKFGTNGTEESRLKQYFLRYAPCTENGPKAEENAKKFFSRVYKKIYEQCKDKVDTRHKAIAGGILGIGKNENGVYGSAKTNTFENFKPKNEFERVLFDTLGYPVFVYICPHEF